MTGARAAKPVAKRKKKTAKKTANLPVLIPQENGRGAIYSGGVPGNKGGPGIPPSKVREAYRKDFYGSREFINRVVNGDEKDTTAECPMCEHVFPIAGLKERLKAAEIQGRHAGLEKAAVVRATDPDVKAKRAAIARYIWDTPLISNDVREQFIAEISKVWQEAKA